MFDVGFSELFLLALIGLLVLGPERLPKVARTLGGLVRKARVSWFALRRTIESELAAADVTEPVKAASREMRDIARQLDQPPVTPAPDAGPSPTDTPGNPDKP